MQQLHFFKRWWLNIKATFCEFFAHCFIFCGNKLIAVSDIRKTKSMREQRVRSPISKRRISSSVSGFSRFTGTGFPLESATIVNPAKTNGSHVLVSGFSDSTSMRTSIELFPTWDTHPLSRMSLSINNLLRRSIRSTEAVTIVRGRVFGLLSSAC